MVLRGLPRDFENGRLPGIPAEMLLTGRRSPRDQPFLVYLQLRRECTLLPMGREPRSTAVLRRQAARPGFSSPSRRAPIEPPGIAATAEQLGRAAGRPGAAHLRTGVDDAQPRDACPRRRVAAPAALRPLLQIEILEDLPRDVRNALDACPAVSQIVIVSRSGTGPPELGAHRGENAKCRPAASLSRTAVADAGRPCRPNGA